MAKWSARQTYNSAVPGLSPALATCWICTGRPEFKSSAMLVNSQLVASCWLGFFDPVMLYMYLNGVPVK